MADGASRYAQRKAGRALLLAGSEEGSAARTVAEVQQRRRAAESAARAVQCQRCLQTGHYTYECKNERAYASRPSRSAQLAAAISGTGEASNSRKVRKAAAALPLLSFQRVNFF